MIYVQDEEKLKPVLVNVDKQEWAIFQELYGRGNVSARIRELVREDIERGSNKPGR